MHLTVRAVQQQFAMSAPRQLRERARIELGGGVCDVLAAGSVRVVGAATGLRRGAVDNSLKLS